ncbi:nucleolar protein 12-like [Haliotis rufescens]|uniref:nucleolar protein 12-like n=1 Tax=Haliotis rufescens TaxID=6454 RepID=UPI001EAFBD2B|nr:nucleolar protein 12-like [Haliotis rufescens]
MGFTKKKIKAPKNRKTKHFLVFDEKARADYLTGFRKRKAERKKYYEEKVKKRMTEERKELRKQTREMMKTRMNQQRVFTVPEVEHLVDATEFDLPNHTVTITDIADVDFSSEGGLRLGQNLAAEDSEEDEESEMKQPNIKKIDKSLARLKKKLQKCGNADKKKKRSGGSKIKSKSVKPKGKNKAKKARKKK